MTLPAALAIVDRPLFGPEAAEFLRCLAAWVATGRPARLLESRPGLVDAGHADPEIERYLDSLAAFEVRPAPLPSDARGSLRDARLLLRLASPDRSGSPALLVLDEATLSSTPPDRLLSLLLSAGQVIRS